MKLLEIIIWSTLIIFITFITTSSLWIIQKKDDNFEKYLIEHVDIISFFSYPTWCQITWFNIWYHRLSWEFCSYKNFYIRKLK